MSQKVSNNRFWSEIQFYSGIIYNDTFLPCLLMLMVMNRGGLLRKIILAATFFSVSGDIFKYYQLGIQEETDAKCAAQFILALLAGTSRLLFRCFWHLKMLGLISPSQNRISRSILHVLFGVLYFYSYQKLFTVQKFCPNAVGSAAILDWQEAIIITEGFTWMCVALLWIFKNTSWRPKLEPRLTAILLVNFMCGIFILIFYSANLIELGEQFKITAAWFTDAMVFAEVLFAHKEHVKSGNSKSIKGEGKGLTSEIETMDTRNRVGMSSVVNQPTVLQTMGDS
jgi:glucan phosphoethanolaminetransferase (alkaline phosphatase superfamily)